MVSSPGFGSSAQDKRLLRLAFAMAPAETALTCPVQLTRWLILQKARSHPAEARLLLLVSIRFHVYFTPLPGVLFTFPSRY